MRELIDKLQVILTEVKDFEAAYSTETFADGRMLVEYKGKRYFAKFEEVENPDADIHKDIDRLKYWG